ncbi:MAG TPA: family 16 glycoside hydrolase [Luteitalea sp.]|nr:family 16 glycoside hydrolase [Luteitalea sp.]
MPRFLFSTTASDRLNTPRAGWSRRQALAALTVAPGLMAVRRVRADGPRSLFDGKTLGGWKSVNFGGEGEVAIADGAIRLERGNDLTGIVWTGALPGSNYRLSFEARRMDGTDFFAAVTFPVAGSHCTFIVGGWGGPVVGFSSLDGLDASENETSRSIKLDDERWYRVAVDVTPTRMQGLIDDAVVAEATLAGRQIDVRIEMNPCRPLGIASWRTTSDLRAISLLDRT